MDQLLVIDIVYAHGIVILQTVWALSPPDILRGRRRTDTETIRDQAYLHHRLGELVPLIAGHLPIQTSSAAA